jgi:hypothetical protein
MLHQELQIIVTPQIRVSPRRLPLLELLFPLFCAPRFCCIAHRVPLKNLPACAVLVN